MVFTSVLTGAQIDARLGGNYSGVAMTTGVITLPAGTAALPALTTSGDTDTGVYFISANRMGIAANGVQVVDVIPSGIGVGIAATTNMGLRVAVSGLIGTTQYASVVAVTASAAATSALMGLYISNATAAASFTCATAYGLRIGNTALGAGSAITNQYGIYIEDQTSAGTTNIGIASAVTAGTNKYNIYASGTAPNYFAGNLQLPSGTASLPALTSKDDLNTGIYFPAADTLAVVTGGVERARFDASGGITYPKVTTAKLPSQYNTPVAGGGFITEWLDAQAGDILGLGSASLNNGILQSMGANYANFGFQCFHAVNGKIYTRTASGASTWGSWSEVLQSLVSGATATYTATVTGMNPAVPDVTVSFVRVGNKVTMYLPIASGTSGATTFTLTGGPTTMRPSAQRVVGPVRISDNGGAITSGYAVIETSGTISIYKDAALGAFTASGAKALSLCSISYII